MSPSVDIKSVQAAFVGDPAFQGVGKHSVTGGSPMLRKVVFICGALLLVASASAFAFPPIDLTAGQANVNGVDGSIWSSNITQPTGTGVYQPFLRLQNHPTEEGFNTNFNSPFPLDDKSPLNWTHAVQWNSLATINISGTDYYSFQLDANEPQGGNKSVLSL